MKEWDKEQTYTMKSSIIGVRNIFDANSYMNVSDIQTSNENLSVSVRRTGHACCLKKIVICLLLVTIFLSDFATAMPRTMICDSSIRCLHGGQLQIPDSPFGFCTCNCRQGYAGLRCQFSRRRNRRIRRLNRLKRLVRLRNNFENLLKLRSAER